MEARPDAGARAERSESAAGWGLPRGIAVVTGASAAAGQAVTRGRGQRGFTLLELLITLSVTTIGLVGLLALHLSVVRGNDGASRSAEAQQIGAATLESLRAQRLDAMMIALTGSKAVAPTAVPHVTAVVGRGGRPYQVTTTVDLLPGLSSSLVRIRVVTSWTEDGATPGASNGQFDHALALEVIRTQEEAQ